MIRKRQYAKLCKIYWSNRYYDRWLRAANAVLRKINRRVMYGTISRTTRKTQTS